MGLSTSIQRMALLSVICYVIGAEETRRLNVHVFSDFDGTITLHDSLVHLLDRYAVDRWRAIEDEVESGSLGEEQGLRREIALLKLPFEEALATVLNEVPVDPDFARFVEYCESRSWPLAVVSGGLRPIIEAVLGKRGLDRVPVHANGLAFDPDGRWRVLPASTPRIRALCNHCKSWHLAQALGPTIYIGDGTTDRCPGARADLLFAKGGLADWCGKEGLSHVRWSSFGEILDWMDGARGRSWLASLTAP